MISSALRATLWEYPAARAAAALDFPWSFPLMNCRCLSVSFESPGAEVFDGVFFRGAEILLGCLFIFSALEKGDPGCLVRRLSSPCRHPSEFLFELMQQYSFVGL